ncbi:sulfatase-like hydrolase/transferase [Actinoplanes teichomyceticus]|uniref:sulfatase-like hydrolase/transferase n=1 Tax=Actinoplanes teichomyceticus TaxID=1867 RepID=UPI000F0A006E|nr:sulfatase-like hydrolase/transferase [Actinoplanes teichomyceticus]
MRRPAISHSLTVLACLIVYAALLYPNVLRRLTPASFTRIPVEAAIGIAVLIVLPRRPRQVMAALGGLVLGWLVIEKCLDMGFFKFLARPFDPVLDWVLFDDAYDFVHESYGPAGAVGAVAAVALLVVAVLGTTTWACLRVTALLGRDRRRSAVAAGGIALAWSLALTTGVTTVLPTVPLAARTTLSYAWDRAGQARAGIRNEAAFSREVKVDAFQNVPAGQLLTGLTGKDVMLTFVESYGRNAVEAPGLAPGVDAVLDAGAAKLTAAGFAARSGWLTSPTFGGGSWLAHSTTMSGLWINNQGRYRNLTASTRLTLPSLFQKAGWDTVSVMPGATRAWPEGNFYGFDRVWDSRNLGYHGPKFSWAPMPDQYTLKKFTEVEYAKPGRGPLFVEMPLVSSHTPWAPIPELLDWDQVGDGSIYRGVVARQPGKAEIWTASAKVRREYGRSIQYSLTTLVDWITRYGNDNLVMVFLGDHQPSPVVTGENASHDVPITIVAKDPAVLDRIAGWGWTDGLKPAAGAPVWPMSAFRDRFLTAMGPGGTTH